MKSKKILSSLFLGIVVSNSVVAQQNPNSLTTQASLEADSNRISISEIVIVENRLAYTYAQQNKSLQLVDAGKIKALPAHSLNEVLGHVAGVDLRQRGPFGLQADVSIDGGSFEQTLILVDGIKMLDAQTAHHGLNLPVPLEAIDRIEILRGPAARIYGINSLTGAINIVTKKAKQSEVRIKTLTGSSFKRDTSNQENPFFYAWGMQGAVSIVNETSGRHTINFARAKGNGHRYNTAFNQYQILYQGTVVTNDQSALKLMAGYVDNSFGANGFYAAPGDKEAEELVKTGLVSIGYEWLFNPSFSLTPRLSYRQTKDDYRYFRHDLTRARSQHQGYSLSPEIHAIWKTGVGDLGLGLEMRKEAIESSNIGNHERQNYGAYAEFRKDWAKFSMNLGSYVNYNSVYGWQAFPGVDVGWSLTQNLKWTAHAGMSQRIPSFTDLYLNQLPGNIGNPNVLPEEAWQMETGFKFTGRKSIAQGHYFYRRIDQFIDWVYEKGTTPPYQPMNFNQNKVHGFSFSADHWIGENEMESGIWRLGLQYTYLHPSYTIDGAGKYQSKYSMETLRQQLTGQITYQNGNALFSTSARFHERISYKKYALIDMRYTHLLDPVELSLTAQNLFNVQYIEAAAVHMPGRWISLSVAYTMPLKKW